MAAQADPLNVERDVEPRASPLDFLIAFLVAPVAAFILLLLVASLGSFLAPSGSFTHARLKTTDFKYVVKEAQNAVFALDGFVEAIDRDEVCLSGRLAPEKGAVMNFHTQDGRPRVSVTRDDAHSAGGRPIAARLLVADQADRTVDEIAIRWHEDCAALFAPRVATLIFGPGEFGRGLQTLHGYASIGTSSGTIHVYGRSISLPFLDDEQELFSVFEDGFELPPGAIVSAEVLDSDGVTSLMKDGAFRPHWRGFAVFDFERRNYDVTIETGAKAVHIRHIIGEDQSKADRISITAVSRILHDPTLQLFFTLGGAILTPIVFCLIWFRRAAISFQKYRRYSKENIARERLTETSTPSGAFAPTTKLNEEAPRSRADN